MQITQFIGIDVSKSWLDFAVLLPGQEDLVTFRHANTNAGISKGLTKIEKMRGFDKDQALFCLEHTGIYCRPFLLIGSSQGLKIGVESAWKIKRTQSPRGKTDSTDARRIADYAMRFHDRIRLWVPETKSIEAMRQYLAVRSRLIKAKNMLKVPIQEAEKMNFIEAVKIHKKASESAIKALEREIKKVDKDLKKLVEQDLELKNNLELITSIPGVADQTALSMILFSGNFGLIDDPKSMACYSGVAPFENSSGSSIKGRTKISHYANKDLKKVLHMAALSAVRHNPILKKYYTRKVEEGKNKMLVLNAVRNKLIHLIYAIVKRGTPWEEKFSLRKENLVN